MTELLGPNLINLYTIILLLNGIYFLWPWSVIKNLHIKDSELRKCGNLHPTSPLLYGYSLFTASAPATLAFLLALTRLICSSLWAFSGPGMLLFYHSAKANLFYVFLNSCLLHEVSRDHFVEKCFYPHPQFRVPLLYLVYFFSRANVIF